MADPRFYRNAGPFSLGALLERFGAALEIVPLGDADPELVISDVGPLEGGNPGEISYLATKAYRAAYATTGVSVCLVAPDFAEAPRPDGLVVLTTPQPEIAFATIVRAYYPDLLDVPGVREAETAGIASTAVIEAGTRVHPTAIVGRGAEIGRDSQIGPGAVIGPGVTIGREARIHANVVIQYAQLGDRVVVHPNATIGGDGFGYRPSAKGLVKVPQLGRVILQNDVEIGANSTIDRGALADTIVGEGTKIDNLVQVAHNCVIGRYCILAAQVGLSGTTRLGDFVLMGGQSASAGHLTIGDRAIVAARGAAASDLPGGEAYGGAPARRLGDWKREVAALSRLARRPKKT